MRFSKEPVLHNGSSRPTNTSFRVLQMQISPFLRSHGALDLSIKGGYDGGRNTMRSTIGVEIHYNTFQWGEKYDATKFEKRLFSVATHTIHSLKQGFSSHSPWNHCSPMKSHAASFLIICNSFGPYSSLLTKECCKLCSGSI